MGEEDPYNCSTEYETDDDDDIKKVNHNLKGEFLSFYILLWPQKLGSHGATLLPWCK